MSNNHPTAALAENSADNQSRIVLGMLLSTFLGVVKLLAGLIGNSYALVADAIESLTDIAAGTVVLSGIRISARPVNERYPYGYGKAEALAAVVVSMMIFAAGVGIGVEAIHEIRSPHHSPAPFTLGVLVVVVLIKEALYRFLRNAGEKTSSSAVTADAVHHRSDAITSALAFAGISIALLGGPGWEPADDFAALLAALIILWNALQLAKSPVRELLDVQSDELAVRAASIASQLPGVRKTEKVFSRKSGPSYFLDMHIWVASDMNIREAHSLGHKVKDEIMRELPVVRDVLVHIEPDEEVGENLKN